MAGEKRVAASNQSTSSATCAVCLDPLHGTPRPTVSLSCTHMFHLDCIGNTWNAANEAGKCPMCRTEQPLSWRTGADFQATERAALERETLELHRSMEAGQEQELSDSPSDAYDDVCRACSAGGELLLCEEPQCTCAMHLGCAGLSEVPRGSWHCPWCLVARHPQRRRFRSPGPAAPGPAVVTEFVPERRSARRRRAERRRQLGLSAAVSALRRRRILRSDLSEPPSDGEEQRQQDAAEDLTCDEQREESSTASHQRRRRIRRRRCIASSGDESDSHSSSSIADAALQQQWSREEARERAAAAAESRQFAAAATGDFIGTREGGSEVDTAWSDLTEAEKMSMAAMLCGTAGGTLDSTMPPDWHPVDDPADAALLQSEQRVAWISGTRGPLGDAARESK